MSHEDVLQFKARFCCRTRGEAKKRRVTPKYCKLKTKSYDANHRAKKRLRLKTIMRVPREITLKKEKWEFPAKLKLVKE